MVGLLEILEMAMEVSCWQHLDLINVLMALNDNAAALTA